METSSVKTRFDTLPVQLKMEILQLLTRPKDIKSARLVCIKWFRMLSSICPPSFGSYNYLNEVLQILKKSFYPSIKSLHVEKCTESLPIYSSTRCGIPKAEHISLARNSMENTLKMLRYYVKCCYNLWLLENSFENMPSFYLKSLSYESLHFLGIGFYLPSNDLVDFGTRTHLIALTQFLESTKLPNLKCIRFVCHNRLPDDQNHFIQKFMEAIDKFFARYGQQFTDLCYCCVPPLMLTNSLRHACNLQELEIGFGEDILDQPDDLIDIRQSLKQIKKLNNLDLKIYDIPSLAATQFYSEFLGLLRENRKFLKTFCLHSLFTTIDWIPVNYELELKVIGLKFREFRENTLTRATNDRRKLKSVKELWLTIWHCTFLEWITHISPWLISTFPNLTYLSLNIRTKLNLSDFRSIWCNLVYLKKMFIEDGYAGMSNETGEWLKMVKRQTAFIKTIEYSNGLMILISRPFPNDIFDRRY